MKKVIYIAYESGKSTAGVDRKIDGQIKAMRESGMKVRKVVMPIHRVPGWKLLYRLPFTNINPYWSWHKEFGVCDAIYLRYPMNINIALLRLLKEIKRRNPDVKMIVELHSGIAYKYLLESKKTIPLAIKEIACIPYLYKNVDRMAILNGEKEVVKTYRINTLAIGNGMDFSTMRLRNVHDLNGEIHLVAVSMMMPAHGYERLIKGLGEYYKGEGKRQIFIHFVGEGQDLNKYKKIVDEYKIYSHVIFHGFMNLDEMQELYDKMDIAVSALGLYKHGTTMSNVLKNKEYVGAGLPVIGAGIMDIAQVKDLEKYTLTVPNDETAVNFDDVIKFYDRLYVGKTRDEISRMIQDIQSSAEKHLNYKVVMKNVIDYINGKD